MAGNLYDDDLLVSFDFGNGPSAGVSPGENPYAGLITDPAGDLFGTTPFGGAGGGVVFEIAKTANGYAATPTVLASFSGSAFPFGGLTIDSAGDLFGTTNGSGANSKGSVFEIAKSGSSYSPVTTLVSFSGSGPGTTGYKPTGALITDAAGDLFGTTSVGGLYDDGVVFEVAKTGGVYASMPTVLFNFNNASGASNGDDPQAGLVADSAGDLFGTTAAGGAGGFGEVYEIAKTAGGYSSSLNVIYSFTGTYGAVPDDSLIVDANGDLFGTTYSGGANSDGVVFEIAKTAGVYASKPTILATFNGSGNGQGPDDSLIMDSKGDLFGTTRYGGASDDGVVFEIAKTSGVYASSPTTLYSFAKPANPDDNLVMNAAGDLLLTITNGGADGVGGVIELTPPPPCFCRGARLLTHRGEVAVEDLHAGEVIVTASGELRPIKWIGRREIVVARHAFPLEILPVRIRAGAFGLGLPHRDLWLSPEHAVFVDGVLIPIIRLANGANVAQMRVDTVSYFHVELESHDVLVAEGLPAESFLDCGSRHGFSNAEAALELHPTFARQNHEGACAPLREAGAEVESVRGRLMGQAQRRGFAQSRDPGLHVRADGKNIWPQSRDDGGLAFILPVEARELALVSRTWRPADATASGDGRHLGVAVRQVEIDGREVDLGALGAGWHPPEGEGERRWRWTDGAASLPAGARLVVVRLGGEPLYWIEADRLRAAA